MRAHASEPAISLVAPVHDEVDNLRPLYERVVEAVAPGLPFELILVDDGSSDGSGDEIRRLEAEDPRVRGLFHPENRGQTAALATGIRSARAPLVATLDADMQNDPADLPAMVAALGEHDAVVGFRARREDNWVRRASSRIANGIRNRLTHDSVRDTGCGLKLFRREAIQAIPLFDGMHRFLPTLLRMHGFDVIEQAVSHHPRTRGRSKYGIKNRAFRALHDLLAVRWMRSRVIPPGVQGGGEVAPRSAGLSLRRLAVAGAVGLFGLAALYIGVREVWRTWRESNARILHAREVGEWEVPAVDERPAVGFVAFGDAGSGRSAQYRVGRALAKWAGAYPVDLVLLLGDNFYDGVSSIHDPQWDDRFEDVYPRSALAVPFWAALGNHDYEGDIQAQVEYAGPTERWRMPARYYTFEQPIDDEHSVRFVALDTTPISLREDGWREQVDWLEEVLASNAATWTVVFGHHPPRSTGLHGGDLRVELVVEPLLWRHDVDLYIGGHDHHMSLTRPVRGVRTIVSGGGGHSVRDALWSDEIEFAIAEFGFVWLHATADDLSICFVDDTAQPRYATTFSRR